MVWVLTAMDWAGGVFLPLVGVITKLTRAEPRVQQQRVMVVPGLPLQMVVPVRVYVRAGLPRAATA